MKKPEARFWALLRDKGVLPGTVDRMENLVDGGTPDISGSYGSDYWVELKALDKDITDPTEAVHTMLSMLLPSQKVWHKRRLDSKVFVLCRFGVHVWCYFHMKSGYILICTAKMDRTGAWATALSIALDSFIKGE